MKVIEVVCGIIINDNKSFLIARRKPGKSLAGKWELPGGKVEEKETHKAALYRELKEEFSITTEVQSYFFSNDHDYGSFKIKLHAYLVKYIEGDFSLVDHDKIEWITKARLYDYNYAEADIPIIHKLQSLLESNKKE